MTIKCFEEWEYHMRREMQEIVPNVWLGPYASALKTKVSIDYLIHPLLYLISINIEPKEGSIEELWHNSHNMRSSRHRIALDSTQFRSK
jgi:hypothetical protein